LEDLTEENDPRPDETIKFFSDHVGSTEWAWFFQIYNRRTRPFYKFSGKDIMPPNILMIMKEAKQIFDYICIMTPYHDQASREWSDPNWLRNIDPIMVGFIQGMDQMFVLGRWSGTGVFPLLLDCIADTKNHLTLNKHLLKYFPNDSWWYKGMRENPAGTRSILAQNNTSDNGLTAFADRLLSAYDNGLLFPFLRGELKDDPEYKFPE